VTFPLFSTAIVCVFVTYFGLFIPPYLTLTCSRVCMFILHWGGRFALNMAVCADKVPVAKMVDAKVPAFLTGMLSGDNDAVSVGFETCLNVVKALNGGLYGQNLQ